MAADLFGLSLPLVLTVAGVALLIAEAMAPGAHLIVLGVALLVAGLFGLVLGPAASPLVLAAVVLGVGGVTLVAYRRLDIYGGKGVARTKDSGSLAGKEGWVTERVTQTRGQVRLADGGFDPVYSARSMEGDIEEGTRVIVVDPGGGSVLTVASVEDLDADDIDRELARHRAESAEADAENESGTGRE